MTFSSVVYVSVGSIAIVIVAYMGYRLVQFALRTKGDVNVEMARGKTVFKLNAKERTPGR